MITERSKFLHRLAFLDTETTGKDYKTCEVVEMGMAHRENDKWQETSALYKPDEPIKPECSAVTNITNRMVAHCDSFFADVKTWDQAVKAAVQNVTIIGVAHNSFYDQKVLERYGFVLGNWLCTLKMSRKLYANDDTVTAHNLPYLRYYFDVELDEGLSNHRAGTDCVITAMVLERMLDDMENKGIIDTNLDYYDQIQDWLVKPTLMEKVPFGKHRGLSFHEVPMSYWSWALNNLDSLDESSEQYDPDLGASVIAAVEKAMG
jgi:exodeoxyribonuclease X